MTLSDIIIISLEGCHGSGKTALCDEFENQGFRILDEAFMDMPSYALHPQSLLMETTWVVSWFQRVLQLAENERERNHGKITKKVFIADRSPFSAVFYSNSGHLLEPLIREQMKEIQESANIHFHTVHVKVSHSSKVTRLVFI